MSGDFEEAKERVISAIAQDGYQLNLSGLKFTDAELHTLLRKASPGLSLLNLTASTITELPDLLWQFESITMLSLGGTSISTLSSKINRLKNLDFLDLQSSKIKGLPEVLHELPNLTFLSLSATRIRNLNTLTFPPSLWALHLDRCDLSLVPPGIFNVSKLEVLNLAGNQISSLPPEIARLSHLKELRLSDNRLTRLPREIGRLPRLKTISMNDNPLSPELAAAAKEGAEELLAFVKEVADDGEQITEAKLVLVGEGAVGKSSLLSALLNEPFDPNRDTTHGIEIKPLKVSHAATEIVLNCWDFGGQPVYRPTHQLFFTKPAVYLVLWKPREGPELGQVEYWISLIKDRAGAGARVHVVATHGGPGQRPAQLDRARLLSRFGDMIAGFHHVDSETGDGISELTEAIAETAHGLEHVTRLYPRSWLKVLGELAESEKTYLRYEQFQAIAAKHGLSVTSARSLARNAHALGQMIYYDDDPALRDLVVLKADWLSVAIGFVLEDQPTERAGGLLPHRHLPQIWDSPDRAPEHRYSHELQQMFLRLMERFDLTYRAPELTPDEPLSLVTQLLPGEPPESLAQQWAAYRPEDGEVIQVCQFVEQDTGRAADPPPGLMARLIVLFHRHSLGRRDINQSVHWLHGLILEDRYGARALLTVDGTDLTVRAKGVNPDAFLSHLVHEIRENVESFWKGRLTKVLLPCPEPCGITGALRGHFDLDTVYRRRGADKATAECRGPECGHDIEINSLVGGRRSSSTVIHEAVSGDLVQEVGAMLRAQTDEILHGQRLAAEQISNGLWELGDQIDDQGRELFSRLDERLAILMRSLDDEANNGPRLFELEMLRSGPAKHRMRLTLWCEHSKIPVHLLEPGKNAGVYTVEVAKEWWAKAAPLIKATSTLLKVLLPIGLPVIKEELDDTQWKAVEEKLSVMKESLGAAATLGADLDDPQTTLLGSGRAILAEGGMLRMLHATLREQDITYADLRKVRAGQRILWVHPRFEHIYNPDPPRIPT